MIPPLFGKQEVRIWRVKKRFPRYGVHIWSLWPNVRFLPSIVAEKNATKNGHIQNVCSMCIKINKVGKQEVGIWWVQKRFPRYGVPIWSLWPNIRFLPLIVGNQFIFFSLQRQLTFLFFICFDSWHFFLMKLYDNLTDGIIFLNKIIWYIRRPDTFK
jgi:hypothetical protein